MRTAAAAGVKQPFPRRPCRKNNVFRRNFLARRMIPEHNPHAARNPARQTTFGGAWRPIIPEHNPHAARNPALQTISEIDAGRFSRKKPKTFSRSKSAKHSVSGKSGCGPKFLPCGSFWGYLFAVKKVSKGFSMRKSRSPERGTF